MPTTDPTGRMPQRRIFSRLRALFRHVRPAHGRTPPGYGGRRRDNGRALAAISAPQTIQQAVDRFVAQGYLSHHEAERYLRGQARWQKVKGIAVIGGTAIVGLTVLVLGRKLFLRLRTGKAQP